MNHLLAFEINIIKSIIYVFEGEYFSLNGMVKERVKKEKKFGLIQSNKY